MDWLRDLSTVTGGVAIESATDGTRPIPNCFFAKVGREVGNEELEGVEGAEGAEGEEGEEDWSGAPSSSLSLMVVVEEEGRCLVPAAALTPDLPPHSTGNSNLHFLTKSMRLINIPVQNSKDQFNDSCPAFIH